MVSPDSVWDDSAAIQHKVTFISSFEKIPKKINIAIVATNADVRPQVVKQIKENFGSLLLDIGKVFSTIHDNAE